MNNFKSKKFSWLICLLAVTLCLSVFTGSWFINSVYKVSATTNQLEEYSDSFSGDVFSAEWENDGAELVTDYNALAVINSNSWSSTINLLYGRIPKPCTIRMEVNFQASGYFGVCFGLASGATKFSAAHSALILNTTESALMYRGEGTTQLNSSTMAGNDRFDPTFTERGVTTAIKLEIGEDNSVALYANPVGESEKHLGTWQNAFFEGFMGVSGWSNASWEMYEFSLEDDSGVLYYDDFTSSTISYSQLDLNSADWFSTLDETKVVMGNFNCVRMQGESKLISTFPIVDNGKTENQFEISYKLRIKSLAEREYTGLYLGMDRVRDEANSLFVGVGRVADYYVFSFIKNGKVVQTVGSIFVDELPSSDFVDISFFGKYGKRIEVTLLGKTYTFENVDFSGRFAIGNKALNGTQNAEVFIDDFEFDKYVYRNSSAEDMAINFKGTKTESQEGINLPVTSYYINKYKFYYNNVTIPRYTLNKKGEVSSYGCVRFTDATSNPVYPVFIPRNEYGEFILRFNLKVGSSENIAINRFSRIGVSVGLPSIYSTPVDSSSFFFQLNKSATAESTILVGLNMDIVDGKADNTVESPIHIWQDDTTVYNVMLVVMNGTVKVYFKPSTAPESEMSVLRAKFVNANTYGYVAVTGYNNASFEITDYSITNINPFK